MTARSRRRDRRAPGQAAHPAAPAQGRELGRPGMLELAGLLIVVAKLVAVVLVVDPAAGDAFALPKSAVSRALAWPLLLLTAVQLYRRRTKWPRALVWSSLAYVGVAAAATLVAVHPYTSAFGAPSRLTGLTQLLDGMALGLGVAVFTRDAWAVRLVARAVMVTGMTVAVYAVIQAAGLDPVRYAERFVGSTVGNPGATAGFALIVAAMAGAIVLSGLPTSRVERVGVGLVGVASLAVVVLTGARGPLLAIAIGALAVGIVAAQKWSVRSVVRRWPAISVMAAVLALLAGLGVLATPAGARLTALATGGDLSTSERALIYAASLEATARRPLLGVGLDGLVVVYPSVRPAQISAVSGSQQTQTSTHSWFLHQLLGTGATGLVVTLALLAAAVAVGWPMLRSGSSAAAIGVAGLVAFLAQGAFNIVHIVTETMLWLSLGLIASSAAQEAARERSRATSPRWLAPVALGGAALAAIVAAQAAVDRVEASRAVRGSNVARASGQLVAAERAALRATELDPGRADHWNVLGLARAGRSREAASAFRRASEAAPYEPVYLLNLAREEALSSQRDPVLVGSAREHADRASALDPNNARTHRVRSEILAVVGALDEALAAARRAVELEPSASNHDWAARVYAELGRPSDAIESLRAKHRLAYPTGELPLEERLRFADLYVALGDTATARSLFAPPRVSSADASCQPNAGSARLDVSTVRPRCIRIAFAAEAPLLADGARPGSVVDPTAYVVGGSPLPAGATASYDGGRFVTIQLPATALPPGPRTPLVVRGVTDVYGSVIRPDPAELTIE